MENLENDLGSNHNIGQRIGIVMNTMFASRKEFCEYFQFHNSNVTKYIKGANIPKSEKVLNRFDTLGINRRWLLYGEDPMMSADNLARTNTGQILHLESNITETTKPATYKVKLVTVPLNAGAGYNFDDLREGEVEVDVKLPEHVKAFIVSGDSMSPYIPSGSMVFVDTKNVNPEHGDLVAIVVDGEALCKRLIIEDGKKYLTSDNRSKKYNPIHINGFPNHKMIGVVVRFVVDLRK